MERPAPPPIIDRLLATRAHWAKAITCDPGRARILHFQECIEAVDRALAREAAAPGYLDRFSGLWVIDMILADNSDCPALVTRAISHEKKIMTAGEAARQTHRAHFRAHRAPAPIRRARPASAPTRRPRQRAHRAVAARTMKATSPPTEGPSGDPDPPGEPYEKIAHVAVSCETAIGSYPIEIIHQFRNLNHGDTQSARARLSYQRRKFNNIKVVVGDKSGNRQKGEPK